MRSPVISQAKPAGPTQTVHPWTVTWVSDEEEEGGTEQELDDDEEEGVEQELDGDEEEGKEEGVEQELEGDEEEEVEVEVATEEEGPKPPLDPVVEGAKAIGFDDADPVLKLGLDWFGCLWQ